MPPQKSSPFLHTEEQTSSLTEELWKAETRLSSQDRVPTVRPVCTYIYIHIIKLSQYTHSRKLDYSKLQCDKVKYSQTILKYVFEPLQSQSTLELFTLLVISYKLAFRHKTVISLLTKI